MAGRRYEPAMMVALLLYAYARGSRSSRGIERRVRGGRRVPRDRRAAGARSRDDRALSSSATRTRSPSCSARCWRCAREAGLVEGRGDRDRRHEGAGQRVAQREPRLRADRARDPRGGRGASTRPRTSSTATRAATSCRRSSPPRRAAAGGCARPSSAWTTSAPSRPQPIPRSRAEARCRRPSGAWRRSSTECAPTRAYEAYRARGRMKDGRRFGRAAGPLQAAGHAGRARSTSPTPTRAIVKSLRGWMQGYNAQAVTNEHQIVLAAEIDDRRRRTSGTSSRWSTPPTASSHAAGVTEHARGACSPTPATGTSEQMQRIVDRGIHGPDPARRQPAQSARGRAGTAASTRSCAACWPPTAAASSTANASR